VGKQRIAIGLAAVFVCAGLVYLVKPFTTTGALGGWFGYGPTDEPRVGQRAEFRIECSGPWRQVVDPPAAAANGDEPKLFVTVHDRQPMCKDIGRSRAIASAWLFAAAVAILGLTGAWRRRRVSGPETEPVVVDVI
jgi:hypothetical protein